MPWQRSQPSTCVSWQLLDSADWHGKRTGRGWRNHSSLLNVKILSSFLQSHLGWMSYLLFQSLGFAPNSLALILFLQLRWWFPHGWMLHLLMSPAKPSWRVHAVVVKDHVRVGSDRWSLLTYPCQQPLPLPPQVTYWGELVFYIFHLPMGF